MKNKTNKQVDIEKSVRSYIKENGGTKLFPLSAAINVNTTVLGVVIGKMLDIYEDDEGYLHYKELSQPQKKVIGIPSRIDRTQMIFQNTKECAEHFLVTENYINFLIESGRKYKQYYFDFMEE